MRILFVSPEADGVWFVWLLRHEGHDVSWVTQAEKYANHLSGIIPPPLSRAPDLSKYDLVVFDSAGLGDSADLARSITPTIGSSELADRLEHDRVFGFETMQQVGINVPRWEPFYDRAAAIAWLKEEQLRTVLKPIDDSFDKSKDATYVSSSAEDMIAYIETKLDSQCKSFVLQEFVEGTEVSTEAWWTGSEWVALNHTLEEKKMMAGGIGPNTGCAGNLLWMPQRTNALFQQGLKKMETLLRETDFVGMLDLNTIVTEGEIYGLEWTPRFGYEGTCNLTRLLPVPLGDFLYSVAVGKTPTLAGSATKFAATVRLSVPPYPYCDGSRRKVEVPIAGLPDDLSQFVLYDVVKDGDVYHTTGTYNCIGSPIGEGPTIAEAFAQVEGAIKALKVPNMMYRNDIQKCVEKRYATIQSQGWLRSVGL